ncbi:hypothetical protein EHM76_00400 [bacterium]|nr:MAG: hypothetical protein EHM76_00400 [bacterium]
MPGRVIQAMAQQARGGIPIPEILSTDEMNFMQQVFPSIRSAGNFSHPDWAGLGYPDGPPLSPVAFAAMKYVWPQIRVAADFSHPNWAAIPVPVDILAAAMPIPEAPMAPAPAFNAPPQTSSGPTSPVFNTSMPVIPAGPPSYYQPAGPLSYEPLPGDPDPPYGEGEGETPIAPVEAGMFGGLSLPMLLTIAGGVLFFSLAKGARSARGGKKRRSRRG